MKAAGVILAAGRGSRMKALTEAHPKCLVELAGKPLLRWQLAALRDQIVILVAQVLGQFVGNFGLFRTVGRVRQQAEHLTPDFFFHVSAPLIRLYQNIREVMIKYSRQKRWLNSSRGSGRRMRA